MNMSIANNSSKLLLSIKNNLEELNCPYLEDGSEQWLAELLLHPSEARVKLLSWIVLTYDSKFEEILDNSLPVISNRIDSRHQKLLLVLNIIGVCKIDDLEMVRGTASQKKQLQFWNNLTEMLYTSQFGYPYGSTNTSSQNTSYFLKPARAPTVTEVFDKSCKFMDTLVREHKVNDLFSTELHLFSPDLETQIKDEMPHQSVPTVEMLCETVSQMKTELERTSIELQDLFERYDFKEPDQSAVENYCRKIDLSMKTFSQMIDSFLHCYENDIETWCNKQKPNLSAIGPSVKSVANILHGQQKLTDSLKLLSLTTKYLSNDLKKDLKVNEHKLAKPNEIAELRDTSAILQLAIQRRKTSENS